MGPGESNHPSFRDVVALFWNNRRAFLVCLKVDPTRVNSMYLTALKLKHER